MGYGIGQVNHSLTLESFPQENKLSASSHRGGVNMMFLCFRRGRQGCFVCWLISIGYICELVMSLMSLFRSRNDDNIPVLS